MERAPGAVLNVSASTSGRYPNAGPRILIDAGIVLVDDLGESVFEGIRDGQDDHRSRRRGAHRGRPHRPRDPAG